MTYTDGVDTTEVVRLLILQANPLQSSRLRLDEEHREIERRIRSSRNRFRLEVKVSPATRLSDIVTTVLWHDPDILHFSGHGYVDDGLVFEDDFGASAVADTNALKRLLSAVGGRVSLVVLNACWSENQAAALSDVAGCSIGMSARIGDDVAVLFAAVFYEVLSFGKSVATAFRAATAASDLTTGSDPQLETIAHMIVRPDVNAHELFAPVTLTDRQALGDNAQRAANIDSMHFAALREFGRKRTAFPTDLSFQQLIAEGLFVPPRPPSGDEASRLDATIAAYLERGESVLLLGEPGSGKSLLCYSLLRIIPTMGSARPLVVDASTGFPIGYSAGEVSALEIAPTVLGPPRGRPRTVALIDAIDESVAGGAELGVVSGVVRSWLGVAPTLVICRRHEYESLLSAGIRPDQFDHVITMQNWVREREVVDYLARLRSARYKHQADALERAIQEEPALEVLCRRPLYIRMLTFVAAEVADVVIPDVSGLYSAYIGKLLRSADQRWTREPGAARSGVSRFCTYCYEQRLMKGSAIPLEAGLKPYQSANEITPLTRALSLLFDTVDSGSGTWLRPIHYSFFEYLVAEGVFAEACKAIEAEDVRGNILPARDLTREIRHFVVAQMRSLPQRKLAEWLAQTYSTIGRSYGASARVQRNFLIYLAGRTDPPLLDLLEDIASVETDDWLLNSAYSAMCEGANTRGAELYLAALDGSATLRSINRGYHLYYFYDMPSPGHPPYLDSTGASWARSREWLNGELQKYREGRPNDARLPVHLFTFHDFCLVKSAVRTSAEVATVELLIRRVAQMSTACHSILTAKLKSVREQSL